MEVETITKHLAEYKNTVLNISANGIWKRNNRQYAHILPESLKDKNILNSAYHKKIIDEIKNNGIKLHSDFHHLNSSQALCFNLFYPIFFENIFAIIFDAKNETIEKYIFEYIENNLENTNFDLFVKTNKNQYYFEIKYTENEFGKAKNDTNHLQKYNDIYKEKLKIFNNVSKETFFKYYQIFRNIIYNNGYNVFVFPQNRTDLKNTITEVIEKYCTREQQQHISILPIEEIVNKILNNNANNEKLIYHYNLFIKKYII